MGCYVRVISTYAVLFLPHKRAATYNVAGALLIAKGQPNQRAYCCPYMDQ